MKLEISAIAALAALLSSTAMAQERLTIGAGNPGGSFFQAGSALTAVINDHVDGLSATAETTGGSSTNIQLLAAGEIDLGMVSTNIGAEAWTGTGSFTTPTSNLRVLVPGYPGANMFVTLASDGHESVAGLDGRTVNTGAAGGANAIFAVRALEAAGATATEVNQNVEDAARALGDGRIDAYVVQWPSGIVSQQETTTDLTLLFVNEDTMGAEALAGFRSAYPGYSLVTIPAGTYKAVVEDTPALGQFNAVVATDEMSDDTAYAVIRALFENKDAVATVFPFFADQLVASNEAIAYSDTPNIPYHPGAVRYFQELGLTVPGALIAD